MRKLVKKDHKLLQNPPAHFPNLETRNYKFSALHNNPRFHVAPRRSYWHVPCNWSILYTCDILAIT